jgi:CHAD domain-containing protein
VEYLIPEGMSLVSAQGALADRLRIRNGTASRTERTYYDTFDGRLHEAGLVAVHEFGELRLASLDGQRVLARLPMPRPGARTFAASLAQGSLRDALTKLVEVRALLPRACVRSRERPLDVLDSEHKTVVRMRLQQPRVGPVKLRPRLQISAVRGYEKWLDRVQATLGNGCGFEPAATSLIDEAVLVSGGTPQGTPAKVRVALRSDQPAGVATAAVLRALLKVIEANLDGALADVDTEFLHDLRVSIRRTRAVQRELRSVFEPDRLAYFRDEFRWLQAGTSEVRDLDVYLLGFEQLRGLVPAGTQPSLDPVLAVLRVQRAAARRRMARRLRSQRVRLLLGAWRQEIESLSDGPPIGDLVGQRIGKVYRRMVKLGRAIDSDSGAEPYHELRKQGKELRYLLELFGAPLYPEPVVTPMVRRLKSLQDVLGRHQDREVQAATLRSLADEIAELERGRAGLMAMGVLIERLQADKLAARVAFASRFEAFAVKPQRRLMRETFR